MKNIKILIISIICVFPLFGYANDFIGTFSTNPEIFPGFYRPYSEKVKEGIKTLTWKMEITDTDISIWFPPHDEPLVMPFQQEGKYLLAREQDSEMKKYVPFYIENNNTLHGFNTVFFRIK